jgi:hypothetical protein
LFDLNDSLQLQHSYVDNYYTEQTKSDKDDYPQS